MSSCRLSVLSNSLCCVSDGIRWFVMLPAVGMHAGLVHVLACDDDNNSTADFAGSVQAVLPSTVLRGFVSLRLIRRSRVAHIILARMMCSIAVTGKRRLFAGLPSYVGDCYER